MEEQTSDGHRVVKISIRSLRILKFRKKTSKLKGKNQSVQNLFASIPYHAAFGFLIPGHISVLGVYVQGRKKNLFETHPANLWAFLLATFVYCFAFAIDMKFQSCHTSYSQLSSPVAVISGSLCSVSVVSIFIGNLIFIPWALMSTIIAGQHAALIKDVSLLLHQKILRTKFLGIWDRLKRSISKEQPRLPV